MASVIFCAARRGSTPSSILGTISKQFDDLDGANAARRLLKKFEIAATFNRILAKNDYENAPGWLVGARSALEHANGQVSITELARWAGVHRATLAKNFASVYGVSPEQFKVVLKLEQALLAMSRGETIAAAASDAGFFDQAHLTHSWRRHLKGTPSQWLRQATILQDSS